jgi:hypothetical protein
MGAPTRVVGDRAAASAVLTSTVGGTIASGCTNRSMGGMIDPRIEAIDAVFQAVGGSWAWRPGPIGGTIAIDSGALELPLPEGPEGVAHSFGGRMAASTCDVGAIFQSVFGGTVGRRRATTSTLGGIAGGFCQAGSGTISGWFATAVSTLSAGSSSVAPSGRPLTYMRARLKGGLQVPSGSCHIRGSRCG